jgi:hypothetical protein
MDAIKEKKYASGDYKSTKGRFLVNGKLQKPEFTGESSSPVSRIESIFYLAGIAAYQELIVFKLDVICAYPFAKRTDDVQYKYIRVNKEIASLILEIVPEYAQFIENNGTMILELDQMLYGMKEAGLKFYNLMTNMFLKNGFVMNEADPCVFHRILSDGASHVAITVDDCKCAVSSIAMKDYILAMFTEQFGKLDEGFTAEFGEEFDILGMHFVYDRVNRRTLVDQKGAVKEFLKEVFPTGCESYARAPAEETLFEIPTNSLSLSREDSDLYRSYNMMLMYLGTRTYPECLPAASVYASRFISATEEDLRRLKKSISYLGHDPEHCLVIHPGSLSLVCSSDASYAVHHDGKSHGGVCNGFKGCKEKNIPDSYIMFQTGKQSIVAQSSAESELIESNAGATLVVWATRLWKGFGIAPNERAILYRNIEHCPNVEEIDTPVLYQDNASALHWICSGRGNFKTTKHIRVRYFYIRDLVLSGELKVEWVPSAKLVADLLSKGVKYSIFKALIHYLIGKR